MAGLTFDTLFERGMEYDDSGKGLIIAPMESASLGKTQVVEWGWDTGSSGADVVTYTVPPGKVVYIVTCLLKVSTGADYDGAVTFGYTRTPTTYIILRYNIGRNTTINEYHTFPMALKFIAGDVIKIYKPDYSSAGGSFTGWIDDA